jgi:vitamin B12 transporter
VEGASIMVVVTGTRTPTRVDEQVADLTVLDRAHIERAAGRTLPELLAQQAGIQFAANGGMGMTSSVFIRGLEARHTLLLIDGVRYGSATVGAPTWENIALHDIERIEIVRGPLSGLYGSEAMGGVIQVFSRRAGEGVRTDAQLLAGSNRTGQIAGGVSYGAGALSAAARVQHLDTRGFSATNANAPFGSFNDDRDGFRQTSGSVQFGVQLPADWRADAKLLHSDGVVQVDDGPGVDSRAGLRTQVASLTFGGAVSAGWGSQIRLARSSDAYETLATASPFADLGTISTVQQQLSWENTLATPIGTVLLLAEHLGQTVERPGEPFARSSRDIDAVAVGLNRRAGSHTWQANLRHDRNSQFGDQLNGSAGYAYDLSPAWRVGLSAGTAFVAPSFNQLYYPGFGNPLLLPEEGEQAELSLHWNAPGQELRAAYFDYRIRGYITAGPAPTNVPRTRSDGLSLSYSANVANWVLAASADHVNPRNVTEGTADFGNQLPRRARNSLKAVADVDLGAWRAGASWVAFDHRFDDAANTTRVGGYGVVDLRAEWAFMPQWMLGLNLNNAGDKRYETVYGYNQPGREAYVTLRYQGR